MSFLQAVLLMMIDQINEQRTIASIFHLLKGKKSSQTIQDAKLYHLDKWFQTAPFLERKDFDQMIHELAAQQLIEIDEMLHAKVTASGKDILETIAADFPPLQYLHGWKLQDCANMFWKRLSLTVQVASHFIYQDSAYLPVTRDEQAQRWLKSFVAGRRLPKEQLAARLHRELFALLSEQTAEDPLILVLRLSGKKRTGKTTAQASMLLHMESTEYWYRFLHVLHAAVQHIIQHAADFPLLFAMIEDIYEPVVLTQSTKKTAEMLGRGFTIEAITANRRLKRSTVEDHIVELAFHYPNFSIRPFVSKEMEEKVLQAAAVLSNKKIKPIKDQLPDVSYFQIRLVLAKYSR
ncbi:helix-turn-helix domain-containing protein [Bacillus lumedeiriae]